MYLVIPDLDYKLKKTQFFCNGEDTVTVLGVPDYLYGILYTLLLAKCVFSESPRQPLVWLGHKQMLNKYKKQYLIIFY